MIRTIHCACGCGGRLEEYDNKHRKRKYLHGHNARGKKNPNMARIQPKGSAHWNYKRGWILKKMRTHQYKYILKPEHPFAVNGYVPEHRLIIEKKIGRYLTPIEHVHHKNGNTLDNRLSNLKKTDKEKHARMHRIQDIKNGKKLFGR